MAMRASRPSLVPELEVTSLVVALGFYVDVVGFHVVYDRPNERFAYLALDGAELMVEELTGPGRRFRAGPVERPFGRGVNFQLAVRDVDALYARVLTAGLQPVVTLEERWYHVTDDPSSPAEVGNRQFVVADPDGYLWRPFSDLGIRRT
jgi:catechol 2,3-dioxygenase-like lactoylglutathione lyase family enzyme